MKRHLVLAIACAVSLSFTANKAYAAPQILAALPAENGIALTCTQGICCC